MMKKKKLWILLIVLLALVAGAFHLGRMGDVSQVQRTIGKSSVYTESEIEEAMDVAEAYFRTNLTGCKLLTLDYDADWWYPEENWAEIYKMNQAIIVTSSFYVPAKGADACWNPDSLYTEWQWVLVRNNGEAWTMKTCGYG